MRPGQAGGVLPFLGSSGPVEMAVDALNLFLIKEKAPACVRDELLERELGRRSQRERHRKVGSVRLTGLCLVAQSCLTLCDPVDYSPPGSSVHGDSPGKNTGVGCHFLLQGIFPTQGSNLHLLHCRQILYSWATREALLGLLASKMDSRVDLPSEHDRDLMSKKICKALNACMGRGWYVMGAAWGPHPQHCWHPGPGCSAVGPA